MALFNSFQFGDVDSKDYGVYISGDSVYDSPARSVDLVQVPGRNGALALDNGYYENIEVTYPAGSFGTSQEEWREKMLGIRNALAAQRGYQRLIDTYHPEHYRLGMFFAGISASPVQYNRAGQFPIRFNCKPQRFLISGDEAVEFTAEGQEEVYGPSSIASFEAEEGAEIRQLEVDLEPVQNLNGYDNPWPAGGGKNLLPLPPEGTQNGLTLVHNDDGSITITGTSTAITYFDFFDGDFDTEKFEGCLFSAGDITLPTNVRFRISNADRSSIQQFALTGTVGNHGKDLYFAIRIASNVTLPTGGLTIYPMLRLATISDDTFVPYENICPISGHTEVNVYRTGKNLLPLKLYRSIGYNPTVGSTVSFTESSVDLADNSDGTYSFVMESGYRSYAMLLPVKANTTVHIKLSRSGTEMRSSHGFIDANTFEVISKTNNTNATATLNATLSVSEIDRYFYYVFYNYGNLENFEVTITEPQAELGTTATAYEPYAGNTYNVPLGQTVYGGTLNVTTGELTIDRAMAVYDGTEGGWTLQSINSYGIANFQRAVSDSKAVTNPAITNILPAQSTVIANTQTEGFYLNSVHALSVRVNSSRANTVALFKTWLASNNLQLCYELATPTTVQLTATQVSTLLGQNNIWSDSGEVEVTVASPVDLTNPTNFPAKPLIRVYGNGSVQVGDTIATIQNNTNYIDIDCEAMNCTDGSTNRNSDVSFSGNDFPVLEAGNNSILLNGPSNVEITPRWWEL